MRAIPVLLAALACLAGCKSKVARPAWDEDRSPAQRQEPPPVDEPDADAGELPGEEEAERVRKAAPQLDHTRGILEVLGPPEKTGVDIFGTGELSEEDLEAIDRAIGTLDKKPPPPLAPASE